MRTLSVISFLLLLAVSCGTSRQMSAVPEQKVESSESNPYEEYSPNTLIIMCDQTVGKDPLYKAIKEYGAEIIYDYSIIYGMAVKIPDGKLIEDAIEYFKTVKGVISVNRDRIMHLVEPVQPRLELSSRPFSPSSRA